MPGRWLLFRSLLLPAACGVALAAAIPAYAQEPLPVQIKADTFRYDRRTRVLTATGNVVLIYQDVTIRADALVANLDSGDMTAEGRVLLEVGGQSVSAELLSYNLTTRFGTLTDARASYFGPLILGPVRLRAQKLEGVPDRSVTIRGGFLTTCDEDDPVVHLTADEITVYLGDRIVGRRVSVWVGGRRVFTLPFFQIFLRERRDTRLVPIVGYSEPEGIFVKTTYSYVLNQHHYGFLYGDWMERLGIGTGVEHLYQFGEGHGAALVYRLENRQTSGADLRAILNHTQQLSPSFRAQVYADYSQRSFGSGPPTSALFGVLDLTHTSERSTTYLFAIASTITPGSASFLSGRLAHGMALSPQLTLDAFVDFSRVGGGSSGMDDEAAPRLAFTYAGGRVTASLVADLRWDLDGDRFPFDARYTVERLPELTFTLAAYPLGGLVLQVDGGLGRFRETTVGLAGGTLDAGRADATLTLSGPIPLGGGTMAGRAYVRGTSYTTGAARLFYGGQLDYTRSLGSGLVLRLGYSGQTVSGRSPFLFDQITGGFSVADASLFYQTTSLIAQASVFYDFQLRQWGRAVVQAVLLPQAGWVIGLAASHNLTLGQLERVEAALDLRLSDEWHLSYVGVYDGFSSRFVHDRIALTRIFCDCLAVSLSYLGARGELWLEAWLTAIPWGRGRVGIGQRGNLLFDLPTPNLPRP